MRDLHIIYEELIGFHKEIYEKCVNASVNPDTLTPFLEKAKTKITFDSENTLITGRLFRSCSVDGTFCFSVPRDERLLFKGIALLTTHPHTNSQGYWTMTPEPAKDWEGEWDRMDFNETYRRLKDFADKRLEEEEEAARKLAKQTRPDGGV